jgi:hypothetical protein
MFSRPCWIAPALVAWASVGIAIPALGAQNDEGPTADSVAPLILPVLAGYPKPIRGAILELSTDPILLAKLAENPKAPLAPLLVGKSKVIQDAATMLSQYPDILKVLQSHERETVEIGSTYLKDRQRILDQLEDEVKAGEAAVDAWVERLEGEPEALEQLTRAVAEFQTAKAKEMNAADAAILAGVAIESDNIAVVALPTPMFINYAMSNADAHPALANHLVGHWLSSRNTVAFDHALNHWWGQHHEHFHHSLLENDGNRAHRLAEMAKFNRTFAKDAKRWDKLKDHHKEFPHLSKAKLAAKGFKGDRNKKPPVKEPPHKASGAKGKGAKHAHRAKPTHHQHVHHATASHAHHAASHKNHAASHKKR